MTKYIITVTLNEEQRRMLEELAQREQLKYAQVMRRALVAYYKLRARNPDIVEHVA